MKNLAKITVVAAVFAFVCSGYVYAGEALSGERERLLPAVQGTNGVFVKPANMEVTFQGRINIYQYGPIGKLRKKKAIKILDSQEYPDPSGNGNVITTVTLRVAKNKLKRVLGLFLNKSFDSINEINITSGEKEYSIIPQH